MNGTDQKAKNSLDFNGNSIPFDKQDQLILQQVIASYAEIEVLGSR